MDLDGFKAGCVGTNVSWVICDEVPARSDSCTLFFFLFRSHGADGAYISDGATLGDLVFVDEENGIGAFDSVTYALDETAQFICTRVGPNFFVVWIGDMILVFHLFTCRVMGDGMTMW